MTSHLNNTMKLLLLAGLSLMFIGCAAMEKRIDENASGMEELRAETATLSSRIDDLDARMSAIENSIASVEAQSTEATRKVAGLGESVNAIKSDIDSLKRRQSIGSAARKATLKVKVLTGDNDIKGARKTAKRLNTRGFSIRIVDYTPEPKFTHPVVYYAKGFRYEAREIGRVMGKSSELRKLTWNSVFDIIVVTAGK